MLFGMQRFRVQYFVTIIFFLSADLSGKYDLAPQNSTFCFTHKLSNLFYFIKLTSVTAIAFTDSKFKVFIQSSIRQKMHFKR